MKRYVKANQKVYDILADEYKSRLKDYVISDRKIAAPFISYLKKHFKSAKVLELGPGSGLNLSFFEKAGFVTTAIDISREILRVAEDTAPRTKYLLGDFLGYDFGRIKYDGIFAKAFIHLFPKSDAVIVLSKIAKLLVNGGAAFIATTVNEESVEGFFEKEDYQGATKRYRKKWTEDELMVSLADAGFKIINKGYHNEPDKKKKWVNLVVVKK